MPYSMGPPEPCRPLPPFAIRSARSLSKRAHGRRLHWELRWERYPKRDPRVHHGGPEEQEADSAKTKTC